MPMTYKGLKTVEHHAYGCEKRRCTARDFAGLAMAGRLHVAAANRLGDEVIKPRIKDIKGAWGWWKSGVALMGRAIDAAYQTVPDDQFERLGKIFEHGVLDINLPRTKINDEGGSVVAVNGLALERVVHYAMQSECAICFKDAREIKQCELYKALKGVIEPSSWESSTCPYRDEIVRKLKDEREKR